LRKGNFIILIGLFSTLLLLPLFHSCISLPAEGNSGEPCNASGTCLPGLACTSSSDCRSSSSAGHLGQICLKGNACLEGSCVSGKCTQATDGGTDAGTDGGGSWTDPTTGYVWQNPPAGNSMTWQSAVDYCNSLNLDGKQWHLPTISELRSLIRDCPATQTGGTCSVTDSCLSWSICRTSGCQGCGSKSGCYWDSNLSGTCSCYWSSSSNADNTNYAWYVFFDLAGVSNYYKAGDDDFVRCARAGP